MSAGAEPRFLHLDEIADMDIGLEPRAGTQPRIRPDLGTAADNRAFEMGERADQRAVLDGDAGTEHHIGFDDDVAPEPGVGGEVDGLRRGHGDTRLVGGCAQPALQHVLRLGELGLGIDAAHLVLLGFERHRGQAHLAGDLDRIGQIELALGVVIPDPFENCERAVAAQRHQSGIAQADGALLCARVLLLADGDEGAVRCDDQAPVAGRIGGTEAERRDRRPFRQRAAQRL